MIEAIELTKTYADGTRALNGVSFGVEPGEIFGLLGPNGSGKTTTVRIFVTLLQATAGSARIAGRDVVREGARVRQHIGYAGQYVGVDQDLTVAENLMLAGRLHGLSVGEARRRVDDLIGSLGLAGTAHRRAGQLSGGMRRRLDLAQAIVHRPAALFLDEPTIGLDPQSRTALWDQVRALAAEGAAVVVTTQYLEEADRLCRRVSILDRGTLVTTGSPAALKDAAGEDRVTIVFGAPDDDEQRALARRVAAAIAGVRSIADDPDGITVRMTAAGDSLLELVRRLDIEAVDVARLQLVPTTLDDVFVAYTGSSPHRETESGRRPSSVFAALHGGRS